MSLIPCPQTLAPTLPWTWGQTLCRGDLIEVLPVPARKPQGGEAQVPGGVTGGGAGKLGFSAAPPAPALGSVLVQRTQSLPVGTCLGRGQRVSRRWDPGAQGPRAAPPRALPHAGLLLECATVSRKRLSCPVPDTQFQFCAVFTDEHFRTQTMGRIAPDPPCWAQNRALFSRPGTSRATDSVGIRAKLK